MTTRERHGRNPQGKDMGESHKRKSWEKATRERHGRNPQGKDMGESHKRKT
jgi:hypothetical protein